MIVALGGDGFMLQTLHANMNSGRQIYGMNRRSVGFLMNEFKPGDLQERIAAATSESIRPLEMTAVNVEGRVYQSLRDQRSVAAAPVLSGGENQDFGGWPGAAGGTDLRRRVLSTPAGCTAYNLSARGPILPLDAPLLALTPVSPFRPRRWQGALLPNDSSVSLEILEPEKRPVNAVADHNEVKSVVSVTIEEAKNSTVTILFDSDHSWDERILAEQFRH